MSATERTPLLKDDSPSSVTTRASGVAQSESIHVPPPVASDVEQGAEHAEVSPQPPAKSTRELLLVVAPMALGTFLAAMDGTLVLSSYTSIGDELKELQRTSWISTGYMLTLASFQPLYGKLSDIFGRKPCLMVAYAIFAVGCLACAASRSMTELIVARAFAGIGGAGMQTIVSIIMSDLVPLRSRGTWQGILNLVWATGMAVGAPIGGILADSVGWRWAFLGQAPLTVVAFFLVGWALKLPKPEAAHWKDRFKRIDFGGALTLVIALCALLLAMDRGGNVAWNDRITITALVVFAVFFASFALVELKIAKEPFAPKRIVANPTLVAAYFCNFFCISGGICLMFYLSLYVQAVLHRSASQAGSALIPGIIAGVIGSLSGGYIMQLTGRYLILTILSFAMALGGQIIVLSSTGVVGHSFVALEIGLFLTALGNGSAITSTLIAIISQAGTSDQAIATAVSYLFRSMGSVLGISIGSTIFQARLRRLLQDNLRADNIEEIVRRVRETLAYIDELPPATRAVVFDAYEKALETTFSFTTVLVACALICSFFIKEKHLGHAK